jgi:hypothetical protein
MSPTQPLTPALLGSVRHAACLEPERSMATWIERLKHARPGLHRIKNRGKHRETNVQIRQTTRIRPQSRGRSVHTLTNRLYSIPNRTLPSVNYL